jgi:hypothetical protein
MSRLGRRAFLRAAGATVALPFLESLAPRVARAQTARPLRLLAFYVPNGIHMAGWTPAETGPDWRPTPILAPLEPLRADVSILTGLANQPARPDGPGDHASGTGAFLSCAHPFKTEGRDIRNGISMDQVAAEVLGRGAAFPSLQLGSEGGASTGGCDSGYSCAYARNISWAGPATPLAKEVSPQAVFDRLFAGADPTESRRARERRRVYQQSVLDFVRDDARALQGRLGRSDGHKLDEYLTGLRALETRLANVDDTATCGTEDRPESSREIEASVRAMLDVAVLAMRCDLTRVITYMLGNAGSNRVYSFLGIGDGHHQISHHQGRPENQSRLQTIDTWEIGQLAYLLSAMKAVDDGEGQSLLDRSLVFFSSEIEDGNAHRHSNLPVVLAGRAGGAIRSGRHIRYEGGPPLANLFTTMLNALGVPNERFGLDGTGPLPELS